MRSGIRALLYGALFSLGIAGCSCGEDPNPPSPKPNPVFVPETFAFDGLCAGGSLRQELVVKNEGRGRLNAHVSFEGEAASSFRLEREGKTVDEFAVEALRSATFEVVYEPKAPAGEQEVWMVITWGEGGQKEILLTGFLSSNPLEPKLAGTWEVCEPAVDCPTSVKDPCCWAPSGSDHQGALHFGKVGVEHSAKVDLRFENRGCEPVRITSVELLPDGDDCAAGDVTIDFPDEGIEIPGAVDVTRAPVAVEFRPSSACTLDRELVVQTTDPANPTFRYKMQGQGAAGSLQVEAPFDDPVQFGAVRKSQSKDLSIPLVNFGNDAVVVTNVELSGIDAGHFGILRLEQCGAEVNLPLEVLSAFDVCNKPNPDECGDEPPACMARIVVTTRYAPQGPGRHGIDSPARIILDQDDGLSSIVRVQGRSEPAFKAYPSQRIAFGSPTLTGCGTGFECGDCKNSTATCTEDAHCGTGERCIDTICTKDGSSSSGSGFEPQAMCATSCGTAARSFKICNEGGFNDLVIHSLKLFDLEGNEGGPKDNDPDSETHGEYIFTLDPGTCQGTIEPDACCSGSIALLDNRGGGLNNAVLAIESNRGGDVYEIDVQKNTTVIRAPLVTSFDVTNNPRVNQPVTVRANVTTEHGGISKYEWRVFAPSPGSDLYLGTDPKIDPANPDAGCKKSGGGCFELLNASGTACSPDGSDCVTLVFYPDMGGPGLRWRFSVDVYGDVCEKPLWSMKDDDLEVLE